MIWIIIAIALAAIFYYYAVKPMHYWTERGVPQTKNPAWFFGDNWENMVKGRAFADLIKGLYDRFPGHRYSGMYQMTLPTLLLRDPELIKVITVKDFDHFVDHRQFVSEDADPLWTNNLFSLTGEKWRDMRTTLSPAFTSSKMRSMYVLITECAERFIEHFEGEAAAKGDGEIVELEMKDAFTRFANDVIASAAFGITCDSLKDRNNEFFVMGKDATNFRTFSKRWRLFGNLMFPRLFKLLGVRLFSKDVADFFTRIVRETIAAREERGIVRPDMIHLLMEARKGRLRHEDQPNGTNDAGFAVVEESTVSKTHVITKRQITDLEITAQALIFFFAGFDTIATAMSFMAYELALNPDVQEKLYLEIEDTKSEGRLTYETILKMKYLDMVFSETLRKWPSAVAMDRVCVEPYIIQPQLPHERPIHVKKGDILWVPIYGIHHDESHYPKPSVFDPERFSEENRKTINPYTYLPFGSGPRNCLGSRFAMLEAKTAIYHLLSKFEIVPVAKTSVPFKICKKNFTLASEDGFWLGLKPRK